MAGHQLGEEGQVSIHFDEYGFKIVEEQDSTDDSLRCHVYRYSCNIQLYMAVESVYPDK